MADWSSSLNYVLENEGGFQNNPSDPGNYDNQGNLIGTKYGISAKVARSYGYNGAMEDLGIEYAENILGTYWNRIGEIENDNVAAKIFDIVINVGERTGIKIVQRAINETGVVKTNVDGIMGDQTIDCINSMGESIIPFIIEEQKKYYYSLNKPEFIAGWINRAERVPTIFGIAENTTLGSMGIALLIATIGIIVMMRK